MISRLKHIKHEHIDFEKWDALILSSSTPFVFAQSFYLNATSPNWDALIIGDYECVFPLTIKKKYGIEYLPQPPFTSQLGAFGKVIPEYEKLFYTYITSNYKLIEIELNVSNTIHTEFVIRKNTFIIDYNKSYGYNQNTKRNITKALKRNFQVLTIGNQQAEEMCKLYLRPFLKNKLKLSNAYIKTADILLNSAIKENCLLALKVVDDHSSIKAIGFFIFNRHHTLFFKGTNLDKAENSGSMHLLMDFAINYFSDRVHYFDFGGGSNSSSLAGFYKGLGGELMEYNCIKMNKLPGWIKLFKN